MSAEIWGTTVCRDPGDYSLQRSGGLQSFPGGAWNFVPHAAYDTPSHNANLHLWNKKQSGSSQEGAAEDVRPVKGACSRGHGGGI